MKPFLPKEYREKTRSNIIVVAAGIAMYALLVHFGQIMGFVQSLYDIVSPFVIGIVLAFLLNSPYKWLERLLEKRLSKKKPRRQLCRILAVFICYLVFLSLVAAFLVILVPELVNSIRSIFMYISGFVNANSDDLNEVLMYFNILARDGEDIIVMWDNVMSQAQSYISILSNVLQIAGNISSIIGQLFIGLIASIYLLLDKDKLSQQAKKLCYALLPRRVCETLIYWMRRSNKICSGFIVGTLIDSALVGVLCYIGLRIPNIEYALLISVIVGLTNILPFFGPFIGAIPSALILLIINPYSALYFCVFILILQQVDGNIISPHILGDSVGISPLWIMFAIILGSGLFGFMGMLLAVPVFALFYAIVKALLDTQLASRGLAAATDAYADAPEVPPDAVREDSDEQG